MRAPDHHFDASGPVGRYWLTNGAGFTVCGSDGRMLGVVAHVVVDPRRQRAARMIVRRRGFLRRPRHVAIDPRAVESVHPESRLFIVPAAERGVSPASRSTATARARGILDSVRGAIQALGLVLGPIVSALDRRLATAAKATLRAARSAARAGALAAARIAARTRRETPRLAAWLAARDRETRRGTLRLLRSLEASARGAARLLRELAVLAALGAASLRRRAAAALAQRAETPSQEDASESQAPNTSERRRDADAPLARDQGSGPTLPRSARRRSRR
jgi:sporulation protein YlmC with PRC-barrel domain